MTRFDVARWVVAFALVSALGCGEAAGTDAGADAGASDGGASDGGARDGGPTDGGPTDGGPRDGGGDGGAGDGGAGDAAATRITLSDVAVYANCMPIVAPDPIIAFWTATVSGGSGSAALLTDAQLVIAGSRTIGQELTVDAPSIPLAGGSGSAMQRKTGADANPTGACGELCGDATFTLTLTYAVGGASIVVEESGNFGCVY